MKSNLFKRAWELAKLGQKLFGGAVKSYFSQSLKIAWSEETMNLTTMSIEQLETLISDAKQEIENRQETKTVTVDIRPSQASGKRKSWHKHVTSVDSSKQNGYAFDGDFLSDGENELDVGSVVIECVPCGSVRNGWKDGVIYVVDNDGSLEKLSDTYDWSEQFVSFRKKVESLLK